MNHDCCATPNKKEAEKNTRLSWKNRVDPFILGIIIVTALILGAAVYFGAKSGATSQVAVDTQVALVVDANRHDWGTIDIDGGIVSKSFAIKNTSETALKIYGVKTSCMCTTAQLKTPSQTSTKFRMHEKNSNVFEVKPGETAELIVEFDPAFHGPSGVGPITRTITMSTNDTNNSTLSFNLMGKVIKKN